MSTSTLPKSLHTVTVLVQVARNLIKTGSVSEAHAAVQQALRILFGTDMPTDSYGLAAIAARKLASEIKRAS